MPGKKMRAIKNPKAYEALRAKGMPKSMAAAISNKRAGAKKKAPAKGKRRTKKRR